VSLTTLQGADDCAVRFDRFRTYLNGKDPLTFTGPENYSFEMFNNKRNLTVRGWYA
jgi:hypothetical protein